jgi:hypothetical protein
VNSDDRLDRIEAALLPLTEATEAGFSGATQMTRVLNDRMMILEGQMTEIIGRLRIIGEQLATHRHGDGS